MNNSFSLQQMSKTSHLDSNLLTCQYKLNLMAKFMNVKFNNPKMEQSELANHLDYSTSTLKRYRNDINMLFFHRIHPKNINKCSKKASNTIIDNISHCEHDHKRPQSTSNDLKRPQMISNDTEVKPVKKNKLKVGANIEIDDKFLDNIRHNNNLKKELAMQIIPNDKSVRSNTVQD